MTSISHESFELLDAIERRGSFAKAAEELNRATSAISYGVQKLEEQLGITIFTRQGRRSVLTPAGRLLLEEGRTILAATHRLAEKAQELATGWETKIRIGVEATLDQTDLFDAIKQFQATHPSIELDIRETLLNGSWEGLTYGTYDFLVGAVEPVPTHRGFRTLSIGEADLVPVIGAAHKGIPQDANYADIQRIANHDPVDSEVARSVGLSLQGHATLYVQTMEQKQQAIVAGLGIGHLPRHRIKTLLKSGELIALDMPVTTPKQYLAWSITNQGKGLAALTRCLSDQLAI